MMQKKAKEFIYLFYEVFLNPLSFPKWLRKQKTEEKKTVEKIILKCAYTYVHEAVCDDIMDTYLP